MIIEMLKDHKHKRLSLKKGGRYMVKDEPAKEMVEEKIAKDVTNDGGLFKRKKKQNRNTVAPGEPE